MKKILLNSVLMILFLATASSNLWGDNSRAVIKNLSAEMFSDKIKSYENQDDFTIIDVRTPEEYSMGRIKGAVNLNFYDLSFPEVIEKLDREKPYFIYCRSGNRSGQTIGLMKDLGFNEVYNLENGINSVKGMLEMEK